MPMKQPVHPGRIVRQDCLEPFMLSVTEAAEVLDVSRQTVSNLVNEHTAISPEMAIRLAKAFGSTPDAWMHMQAAYDLSLAMQQADAIQVSRYTPTSAK